MTGPGGKWRTIDTAPKNGKWILLCCKYGRKRELTIARWRPQSAYVGAHGRFVWEIRDDGGAVAEKVPTHWRPLPSLPVTS